MNAIVPALSVLLAVLLTSLPLGLPADTTFVLPFVMLTMVFAWRALRAEMPAYSAMLLGLLADITTGGPLGYWGLMALLAASAGAVARPLALPRNFAMLWLAWLPCVTLLAIFGWLLASLYFFRWIDHWPFVIAASASFLLFPAILYWLRKLRSFGRAPRSAPNYGAPA
jgi:rod shape-determining protein MreD